MSPNVDAAVADAADVAETMRGTCSPEAIAAAAAAVRDAALALVVCVAVVVDGVEDGDATDGIVAEVDLVR